jgi:hypothetical protein
MCEEVGSCTIFNFVHVRYNAIKLFTSVIFFVLHKPTHLAMPTNIRLGLKCIQKSNNLAYWAHS